MHWPVRVRRRHTSHGHAKLIDEEVCRHKSYCSQAGQASESDGSGSQGELM